MSQPKRYWIDDHSAIEDSDGKWVLHSDYAALVQQGIRDHGDWRSKLNFLEADYKKEIARLRAENERLGKAGDDMARHYLDASKVEWGQKTTYVPPSIERWKAAKEGSDAK